ncbi:MAG TPA: hypothetical protein VHT25_13200 [Solirubrobacteraceae bacterium]|jgi:predicted lipoprotein with Yx(FWY)xxD motif|nr:hypothetical protein [Solirubrobacteraceae bacterium]
MIHPSKPIAIAATAAGLALAPLAIAACGGGGATAATAPKTSSTAATTEPSSTPASVGTASTALGTILVDSQGRTLYLFTRDSSSMSTCTGACATAWPPLTSSGAPTASSAANASLLGTTKRADGSTQVTYDGHPLYRFVKDAGPGETNGQGVAAFGGSWFAVTVAGARVGQPSSSNSGSHHAARVAKPEAPKPAPKAAPEPEAPKPASKPAPAPKAEAPAEGGIPQGNGGDGDADNNGGPSDGDGDI